VLGRAGEEGDDKPGMSNVYLLFPELLLLLIPLLFLLFWRGRTRGLGGIVRLVVLLLLALIAAVPLAPVGGKGVDVVVIADRSRSMPEGSRERELEIVRLLEGRRAKGDRVGIVTYGREARVERLPEEFSNATTFVQEIDPDGSDLGGAIALATTLIPRERPGRLIVLSDGEANGASVMAAAQEAASRGIPIDFRGLSRNQAADLAVESLDVPGVVDEREPFQFSAWVRSDRSVEGEAVLFRDNTEIARSKQAFRAGATQLIFRDLIDRPGVARYRLELTAADDRIPENNTGTSAVRVNAPATILLVNASGQPDNLSRALAAGKLNVQIATAKGLPRDVAGLLAYRAVILENVPATAVGLPSLTALARFATDLGGGLLLTGGGGSFGVGGYFKSVLDPYLPVSMEIKNEHRKLSLAMVVALDRSGSMAAPVGDGRTKMDLANLGTCAAIDTLGPFDEVGVVAVDSAPHVVAPLTSGENTKAVCDRVRGIQSEGGGIFVYTALVQAAQMVQASDKGTRHIVLFADAADAEEPGDYVRLLDTLRPLGITVSVIGLGSELDKDAAFLKDVAARGDGRIQFTATVEELPRLFAQEAITVARSSFVNEPTPTHAVSDMVLLGDLPRSRFPNVDGYNLTYLRSGATMGVLTDDEYRAPILAFWHQGLGRVAALTAEVDGKFSKSLNAWNDFGGFSVGLGRWLLGGDPPQGMRATLDREGGQGIVRVELDPERKRGGPEDIRSAAAAILPPGDVVSGSPQKLTLSWTGEDTLEARFPIQKTGIYLGAVDLGSGKTLPLAPLSLPYSPEFEPRQDPEEGTKTLVEMARVSGGMERTAWNDVFNASRLRDLQVRDLVIPLVLMLLLFHVIEIGGRRLLLFAAAQAKLQNIRLPKLKRRARIPKPAETPAVASASQPEPVAQPKPSATPRPAVSPLARAKARARDRTKQ
jgi:Mg-chelatase subunit ChlD